MKFLVLKDAFVENVYRTKGTIVDLPEKYLTEPTVFQPIKGESAKEQKPKAAEIDQSPEPELYISKKDREKLNLPPEE